MQWVPHFTALSLFFRLIHVDNDENDGKEKDG